MNLIENIILHMKKGKCFICNINCSSVGEVIICDNCSSAYVESGLTRQLSFSHNNVKYKFIAFTANNVSYNLLKCYNDLSYYNFAGYIENISIINTLEDLKQAHFKLLKINIFSS